MTRKGITPPSTAYIAVFIGLFVIVLGSTFLTDMSSKADLGDPATLELQDEYDQLGNKIRNDDPTNNNTIYGKIYTLKSPSTDIFSKVSAGLLLVPQFAQVLMEPVTVVYATVDAFQAAIPWVPAIVFDFIRLIVTAFIALGLYAAARGVL